MKFIIVAAVALVAVAAAIPVEDKPVEILRSQFVHAPEGGFEFDFESADGTRRQETGTLKELLDEENNPRNVIVVRGSFTYINDEGKEETISYVADENGFKPEGSSIPVAPAARR